MLLVLSSKLSVHDESWVYLIWPVICPDYELTVNDDDGGISD